MTTNAQWPIQVMRFDDGRYVMLDSIEQLSWYLEQNQRSDVKRSRELRLALRSLNGVRVQWEYEHRVVGTFEAPQKSSSSIMLSHRQS